MVGSSSYLKTLLPLQSFSLKQQPSSSSSTTTLTSMKIKTLIHTLIYAQLCRLIRAISKAKSIVIQIYKDNKPSTYFIATSKSNKKYKQNKLFFGSFRLHYNWCSSHVTPVPAPVLASCTSTAHGDDGLYYDSTWNSVVPTQQCGDDGVDDLDAMESELSSYLQWLEEKKANGNSVTESDMSEIDKLAELFIANCHEKFRLEKQESLRRFQEMLARSM